MDHSRLGRAFSITVFVLALIWSGLVHLALVVSPDGDIVENWVVPFRGQLIERIQLCWLMAQFFLLPLSFLLGFLQIRRRIHSATWLGIILGSLVGLWSNTEFLAVPYCGTYVSLVGSFVGTLVTKGANVGPSYYYAGTVANLMVWPFLGALAGSFRPTRDWLTPTPNGGLAARPGERR
jgi:hypothetical protein